MRHLLKDIAKTITYNTKLDGVCDEKRQNSKCLKTVFLDRGISLKIHRRVGIDTTTVAV